MIRAIVFDCFGVLAKSNTWDDFWNVLPPDIDEQAIYTIHHEYDAGKLTKDEFVYRLHDLTGHEPEFIEEAASVEGMKNVALLRYIKSLRVRGHKIGLLSNIASDWVTKDFLTTDEQKLFDAMVFSFEVGMTKPDPAIFQLTCQRLGVTPAETVFIDDMQTNVTGARDIGSKAICYTSLPQMKEELNTLLN